MCVHNGMEQWSDMEYVEKVQAGDAEYFAPLLERYSQPVFSLLVRIVGNREDAEELTQDVFLKVFNEMQGFCGSMPHLADLERRLSEEGRFEEFKEKFEEEYGDPWESSRQDFDFIQDSVVDVLSDMDFMSESAARNWCEKATESYQISIEDFSAFMRTLIYNTSMQYLKDCHDGSGYMPHEVYRALDFLNSFTDLITSTNPKNK